MATFAAEVLADSPLAYWRMGEPSGTTLVDASGNGRDGTYMAGVTLAQTGLLTGDPDTAALFDGSAHAYVPFAGWESAPTVMTHEVWFSPASVSGTQTIFCRHGGGGSAWILRLENSNLVAYLNAGGWRTITMGGIAAGATYHVVQTFDGSTQSLYVNGSLVGTNGGLSYSATWTTDPIGIGGSGAAGTPNECLAGVIDEAAFYDTALSAARIAAHYNATFDAPPVTTSYASAVLADSPIAYWPLDETSGSTFADASGHGHTLTAVNGPTLGATGPFPDTAAVTLAQGNEQLLDSDVAPSGSHLSIEFWIKTTDNHGIIASARRGDFDHSIGVFLGETGFGLPAGTLCVGYDTASKWSGAYVSGGLAVNDGQWHHVVAVLDAVDNSGIQAGHFRIYIDGAAQPLAASYYDTENAPINGESGYLFGGNPFNLRYSQSPSVYVQGDYSNIAYYNRSLSSTRVATHYAVATGGEIPAQPATIAAGRAYAHAFANAATVVGGPPPVPPADVTIYATAARASTYPIDADVQAFDNGAVVINAFRATASVVAPDPKVSTTNAGAVNTRHRWRLYDPVTRQRWEFTHSPNQMSSPHRPRAISIFVTPPLYNPAVEARGGMARVFETNIQPYEWTFSGWVRDEEHYNELVRWTRKVNRVELTDHFGRTWSIRFKEFAPDEKRPSHRSDWRFDYEIKATMYGAVT